MIRTNPKQTELVDFYLPFNVSVWTLHRKGSHASLLLPTRLYPEPDSSSSAALLHSRPAGPDGANADWASIRGALRASRKTERFQLDSGHRYQADNVCRTDPVFLLQKLAGALGALGYGYDLAMLAHYRGIVLVPELAQMYLFSQVVSFRFFFHPLA